MWIVAITRFDCKTLWNESVHMLVRFNGLSSSGDAREGALNASGVTVFEAVRMSAWEKTECGVLRGAG